MLTFEKFEKLAQGAIPQRAVRMQLIGAQAERLNTWLDTLPHLDKQSQFQQAKIVISEMIVAPIDDELRYRVLNKLFFVVERLVAKLHIDYINSPQSPSHAQRTSIDEVRALYYLMILAYQGVAFRNHALISDEPTDSTAPKKNAWLKRMFGRLPSNVVRNGISIDLVGTPKRLFILSVYRIMNLQHKLLMEFALTYQRTPNALWGIINRWYLKAVMHGVERMDVHKISGMISSSIHQQYVQSCLASFTNLFAYRRPDILKVFRVLPQWEPYVKATYTPEHHLRIFINLQGSTPPELITPYASINPYGNDQVCLFFDTTQLFHHLKRLQAGEHIQLDDNSLFESRLASIVLPIFERKFDSHLSNMDVTANNAAEMLTGFSSIFSGLSEGKSFAQIIRQNELASPYHTKIANRYVSDMPEKVKVLTKSDSTVHFIFGELEDLDASDVPTWSRPYLPVFSLFALRSRQSTNKHPWRLGIVHWAEPKHTQVAVDGKFLGRVLSVCGVRLVNDDMRGQDFVPALLVSGDGLGRATLVMPRYHFKAGDAVIMRVDDKQTTLRLGQSLLSTDDIEQYQIIRLN